ncbi:hexapeptide repeat-containing transferase [Caballeronia temeraria]|uniref:Serine acetyltransferase n=1 Tax=Caballeronia temeraria TaxID=1777137 RepID=A0A158B998_9BURK|nr:serine O-acetyltransferase [Caballeronia temeraria]SAK66623.1 hexapeptide repeat-containing transferase [Caballeronia temeraria]
MKTFDLIKSDLYRYTGEYSLMALMEQLMLNEGFNYMFWLRLASAASSRPVSLVLNHIVRLKQRRFGFVISPRTKIGPGFYISHIGTIAVNPTAVIGANCNISQGVTIGSNEGKAATIGDNVYIGPNVCIVEDVVIGDNVTIGAGSIVTKDIPPNVTVAGCPARILTDDATLHRAARYIMRPWPASAA